MKAFFIFLEFVSFLVYPNNEVNRDSLKEKIVSVCRNSVAVKYYEVADVYLVRGCPKGVIGNIKGISIIEKERKYRLPDFSMKKNMFEIDTLPWYVNMIHMYDREKLVIDGKGVVCGILDTGLDTQDVYLSESFSGYFKDAVNDSLYPYDDNGHGTAVASLITGRFGIAPMASLAVCKGFQANGVSSDSTILECAQWFYELKKSGVPLYVINNSWGEPDAQYMITILRTWDSMGIVSAFSAGNNGPFYRSIDAPSVYPFTFSIGATTSGDTIAWFSSRGPAPDTGIFADTELWPVPDWNYTKPDFVAPGDFIYVTLPEGYHGVASGTSFATPLFSGILCLLKEIDPDIDYRETYRVLKEHGVVRWSHITYPDSGYGFGRVDVGMLVDYYSPRAIYDTSLSLFLASGIKVTYKIYTIDGRFVKEGKTPPAHIFLEDKPRGIYILKLMLNKRLYTVKFVKF